MSPCLKSSNRGNALVKGGSRLELTLRFKKAAMWSFGMRCLDLEWTTPRVIRKEGNSATNGICKDHDL